MTTRLALTSARRVAARIVAKADGVLAGLPLAAQSFRSLDPQAELRFHRRDGEPVVRGDLVMEIEGDAAAILAAERTALNFLQRLSGVATRTRHFVELVRGTRARILDTRKTTPGLRLLEKQAVVLGGGEAHRVGLFDQVLLKENHFACAAPEPRAEIVARVVAAQRELGDASVIVEARDEAEALAAVEGGAGVVLLDNFAPDGLLAQLVASVRLAAERRGQTLEVEVSGGVDLTTVRRYAECGVDRISIGALTHSVTALDLSLLVEVAA